MKTIYTGKYLSIRYEVDNSLFIQNWGSDINIENFKSEMLVFTELYKQYRPKYALWLQQNFSLVLDIKSQKWVEINVNIPCVAYGNEKCAFIISKDMIAQISVIDTFEKLQSCAKPQHFLYEKDARDWLLNDTLKIVKT